MRASRLLPILLILISFPAWGQSYVASIFNSTNPASSSAPTVAYGVSNTAENLGKQYGQQHGQRHHDRDRGQVGFSDGDVYRTARRLAQAARDPVLAAGL